MFVHSWRGLIRDKNLILDSSHDLFKREQNCPSSRMSRVLIWFLKQILIFIVAVLVTSMTFIIARDIIFNHLFVSQWPKQPSTKQTLMSLESSAIMEDTIWIFDTSGDEEVYLKPLQLCGLESIARFVLKNGCLMNIMILISLQTSSRT